MKMVEKKSFPKIITVAVLGTGSIGFRHIKICSQIEGVKPLAVPKRPGRCEELVRNGTPAVSSMQKAAAEKAEYCIVASDTGDHLSDSLEAMSMGMDILIEKPMAANAGEAKRIVDSSEQTEKKAFVGCVLRFSESLQRFRQWLPEVGEIHLVRIECGSYLPDWRPERSYRESYSARAEEGGVLLDLIHEVDYAGWIFGWPKQVQGRLSNTGRLGIQSEEIAEVSWETKEGGVVSLQLDYLSQEPRRFMKAFGSNGMIEWNAITNTVVLNLPGQTPRVFSSSQTRDERFQAQMAAFLQAVQGKPVGFIATSREGLKALAVCDAARESSSSKKEMKVNYL